MVGAQLLYPGGKIQHGGVRRDLDLPQRSLNYVHLDVGLRPQAGFFSSQILACDAVTAACSVVRLDLFEKAGGFDEVFFPIGFSDTDLCARIQALGKTNIYTPFAQAIHHESASRGGWSVEDFEESQWLSRRLGRELETVTPGFSGF